MIISKLDDLYKDSIIKRLWFYDETDSTNTRAKEYVYKLNNTDGKEADLPGLFLSEVQTAGRGRMGRPWKSPAGTGIWMSYLIRPALDPDRIPSITILTSLAVADSINEYASDHSITMPEIKIKWPNDIIAGSRKICGILTELVAPDFVINGIGINVNTEDFPDELKDKATSLKLAGSTLWDREELIILVIKRLNSLIREYEHETSLEFVREKYNNLLVSINKEVVISHDTKNIVRISRGIDHTGALLVEAPDGSISAVSSGEVSVRGIYGYV